MQFVNFAFAITEAWLILSARKLHWSVRVLAIFSFFVFHNYAVVARNYMLALLLLTAAVRCLLAKAQGGQFILRIEDTDWSAQNRNTSKRSLTA